MNLAGQSSENYSLLDCSLIKYHQMARICTIKGCKKKAKGRGMCSAHYESWRKLADRLDKKRVLPLVERFWSHVDKTESCWLWTASTNRVNGYGRYNIERRGIYAHRFSYQLCVGSIPEGYQIDHLCKVRSCVNPIHLEAVTPLENVARSVSANRVKTHCKYGHEFNSENTYVYGNARKCRKCNAARAEKNREPAYA